MKVAIPPSTRRIEVDGAPVHVHDGFVDIEGVVGSVHAVRLEGGTQTDVAVTLRGAIPAKVGL